MYHFRIFYSLPLIVTLCVALSFTQGAAAAMDNNIMLRHSSLCSKSFTKAERQYGIPKHLLMAVANTESGRYNKKLQRTIPWPWTTNIAGKGGYHDSIHDAMTAVKRAQQNGVTSVDVGCMQVNLKHHPDAFVNVRDAFNPESNVNYAASFLRRNYDEMRSWPKAIAAYHSRTPSKGSKYYALVRKRWRDVRANAGGNVLENTDYMVPEVAVSHLKQQKTQTASSSVRKNAHSTFKIAARDESGALNIRQPRKAKRKISAGEKAATMKIIKVSARKANSDAVVVVTPLSQRGTLNVPARNTATSLSSSKNNIVDVADSALRGASSAKQNTTSKRSNGPRFIFGTQ